MDKARAASRVDILVILALLVVYIVWGSTYLGIKIVNKTMPPLLSAGVRFVFAGLLMLAWKFASGKKMPTMVQTRNSAITGVTLFLFGNGAVVVVLSRVDSGLVALMIALMPIVMVLLEMKFGSSKNPGLLSFAGMTLGLAGLAVIVNPFDNGSIQIGIFDALIMIFGIVSWACGSIFIRNADAPESDSVSAGIQMFAGGIALSLAGLIAGETGRIDINAFSVESMVAFVYLILFGSLLAFTSYNFLLKKAPPALTGTYAYVNPVIALVLGAIIGGEVIGVSTLFAAIVIIAGVVMISLDNRKKKNQTANKQ
jgi:drug/metabolite transporter (DMT)-like permease